MTTDDGGRRRDRPARLSVLRVLVVPVMLLVVVVLGTEALVVTAPGESAPDLAVVGIPPPALPERACHRGDDDDGRVVAAILAEHPRGGRVTSTQVLSCPAGYDGVVVSYTGELLGDLLHRDGGAWVLVNDDVYALERGPLPAHRRSGGGSNSGLSVWLPAPLSERIEDPEELGRPGRRGVVVTLTGTVHRADPQDGGGVTLRATSMSRVAPAVTLDEPFHRPQAVVAAVMLLLAAGLVVARRRAVG